MMSEEERLRLENELLMTCSKAQAINKYIDELEESSKLSELWCKSQQENQQLKERINMTININRKNKELLSVLEEIREYINKNKYFYSGLQNEDLEIGLFENEINDLLQILDKVKE
jgi:hypothetical protein